MERVFTKMLDHLKIKRTRKRAGVAESFAGKNRQQLLEEVQELNKHRTPVFFEEGGAFSGPGPFLEDQ